MKQLRWQILVVLVTLVIVAVLLFSTQPPAIDNVIRSAVSTDLANWKLEPGERIAPGGVWDAHGVGFPFVMSDDAGFIMYYTGYWGQCSEGEAAARYWSTARSGSAGDAA